MSETGAISYTTYNNLHIRNFMGAPDDVEIAALEALIETPLPDSFKSFLAQANGGELFGYALDIAHPEKPVARCFSTLYGTRPRNPVNGFGHSPDDERNGCNQLHHLQ